MPSGRQVVSVHVVCRQADQTITQPDTPVTEYRLSGRKFSVQQLRNEQLFGAVLSATLGIITVLTHYLHTSNTIRIKQSPVENEVLNKVCV